MSSLLTAEIEFIAHLIELAILPKLERANPSQIPPY